MPVKKLVETVREAKTIILPAPGKKSCPVPEKKPAASKTKTLKTQGE